MKKIYRIRKFRSLIELSILTLLSYFLSLYPPFINFAISPLIIAVVLGIILANSYHSRVKFYKRTGLITLGTKQILRLGIVLYGFRISISHIESMGMSGILAAAFIVFSTFFIGMTFGKFLGLDKQEAALISAGSSICGAAAVMASESVIKGGAKKAAVAVSTVVVFGTLVMFIYPLAYKFGIFGFNEEQMGFFVGLTIHEVAHAVGAGAAISPIAQNFAVTEKMLRVLMLVPFLLTLALFSVQILGSKGKSKVRNNFPYFALFFLVCVAVGSLPFFPREILVPIINLIDTLLLSFAMLALGLTIKKDVLAAAGIRPFILAFGLLIWLIIAGFIIVKFFI